MSEQAACMMAPPTTELVDHALRELGWEERITGYKMTASAGNAATDMYSLPAAILFLFGTRWDSPMLEPGTKGTINWLDMNELVAWLRDAVGDADLADAVEERALPLGSYHAQVVELQQVFTERMDQYREVRAAAAVAEADGEFPAE